MTLTIRDRSDLTAVLYQLIGHPTEESVKEIVDVICEHLKERDKLKSEVYDLRREALTTQKQINDLTNDVLKATHDKHREEQEVARLSGYIERVREVDDATKSNDLNEDLRRVLRDTNL